METQLPRRVNHRPRVRDRDHIEHREMKAFQTNFPEVFADGHHAGEWLWTGVLTPFLLYTPMAILNV
ncbi:MAG: hypothetical protein JWR26_2116 [Pedosphaera sp.]|nr:hypothetical protein [Pedosphaera sp.]